MKANLKQDLESSLVHGYADNKGVKIHYASLGDGQIVLFVHGFPDFWYSWRYQMKALSSEFQSVAIDLRGFNLSDQPKGKENYLIKTLIGDLAAVAHKFRRQKVILVGHDWGGSLAWAAAMFAPSLVHRLVVLNSPHPANIRRELQNSEEQRQASSYVKMFKAEGAHTKLSAGELAKWVTDTDAKEKYLQAFERSDFEAMLSLYQNYPEEPYNIDEVKYPKVKCPTLVIHGLKDPYLLPPALNGTWNWIDNELTVVTIPDAGHFVQQDAPDMVSQHLLSWLRLNG